MKANVPATHFDVMKAVRTELLQCFMVCECFLGYREELAGHSLVSEQCPSSEFAIAF